jgi:hypothetical protein
MIYLGTQCQRVGERKETMEDDAHPQKTKHNNKKKEKKRKR